MQRRMSLSASSVDFDRKGAMRRNACRGTKRRRLTPSTTAREGKKNSGDRREIAGHPPTPRRNRRAGRGKKPFPGRFRRGRSLPVNLFRTASIGGVEVRSHIADAGSRPKPRPSDLLTAEPMTLPSFSVCGSGAFVQRAFSEKRTGSSRSHYTPQPEGGGAPKAMSHRRRWGKRRHPVGIAEFCF